MYVDLFWDMMNKSCFIETSVNALLDHAYCSKVDVIKHGYHPHLLLFLDISYTANFFFMVSSRE